MCNIEEFKAYCPESCIMMTSSLPTRGGTFIGNKYRADIKIVPSSEFVGTNEIDYEEDDEGTSWENFLGLRI